MKRPSRDLVLNALTQILDKEYEDDRNTHIELPAWMAEQLSQASPHRLRQILQIFAEALISADADAVCGAAYGQRSLDRRNVRNGYRWRGCDTRTAASSW